MANNLHAAKRRTKEGENDSYYTLFNTICYETSGIPRHLWKGQKVLMNCDEGVWSNFYEWGNQMFNALELEEVAAVGYNADGSPARVDIIRRNEKGEKEYPWYYLKGNGDFRDEEGIALLRSYNILISNPPFSLLSEFFKILIDAVKDETSELKYFDFVGNFAATFYKEIWKHFMNNEVRWGFSACDVWFKVPDSYEPRASRYKEEVDKDGKIHKYRSFGNIRWFTNFPIEKDIKALKNRSKRWNKGLESGLYKEYDNMPGVYEMEKVANIPYDLPSGTKIGVPITYMDKHDPTKFKIIGAWLSSNNPEYGFICGDEGTFIKDGKLKEGKLPIVDKVAKNARIILEKI